jgi:arsenate reductase (glutaredoxin)
MSIKIYHNPKCSKSRKTLELLQERGIEPEIINYLETPPTADELEQILVMLNMTPLQLMRTKEAEYSSAGLDNKTLSARELVELMVANPRVIERPIVVANGKAAVGRPPEQVLEIL